MKKKQALGSRRPMASFPILLARSVREWRTKTLEDLLQSRYLQVFGGLLSFAFVLLSAYWWQYGFANVFSNEVEPICWAFFRDCSVLRPFDQNQLLVFFGIYAVCGVFVSTLFFKTNATRARLASGLIGLGILLLIAIVIVASDYRARLNQNLMILFVTLSFLFSSRRKADLGFVIISFYFWAGLLKFDPEWLSGAAIYKPLWMIPESLNSLAAKYVLFLELIVVWGLLSKSRVIFGLSIFQFALFHLVSLSVVGFFYPALMAVLLSFFVLRFFYSDRANWVKPSFAGAVILSIITTFNLIPKFQSGEPKLNGEGRVLGFHMFDSVTLCDATATLNFKTRPPEVKDLRIPAVVRIRCDPAVFLSRARNICRERKDSDDFIDLDLFLQVWPSQLKTGNLRSQPKKSKVIDYKSFCASDPDYSLLGFNDWILKSPPSFSPSN